MSNSSTIESYQTADLDEFDKVLRRRICKPKRIKQKCDYQHRVETEAKELSEPVSKVVGVDGVEARLEFTFEDG